MNNKVKQMIEKLERQNKFLDQLKGNINLQKDTINYQNKRIKELENKISVQNDSNKKTKEMTENLSRLITQQNTIIKSQQNEIDKMNLSIKNQDARMEELERKIIEKNDVIEQLTTSNSNIIMQYNENEQYDTDVETIDKCDECSVISTNNKKLGKCGHKICHDCTERQPTIDNTCLKCSNNEYFVFTGNQPLNAKMKIDKTYTSLPGYPNEGTIVIEYDIPDGVQGVNFF